MLFLFSWNPYDLDVGTSGDVPESSYTLLIFFEFLFLHCVLVECLFFLMFQIIDLSPGFLLFTVGSLWIFLSLSVAFVSSLMFLLYSMISLSILISSGLNSTSDHLALSVLLSSFSEVLLCSFIWARFFCLLNLAASLCLFLCVR